MLLALLFSAALAQEADPEPPVEPEASVEEVPDAPEPPPEASSAVSLEVSPMQFLSLKDAPQPALSFDRCIAMTPPASAAGRTNPPDGQLVFQIKIRRGRIAVSSLASADQGLDFLTPCLQRELAAVEWPVKRAKGEVEVTIEAE